MGLISRVSSRTYRIKMSKNKRKSNVPQSPWLANIDDSSIFEYKNSTIQSGKFSGELSLKKT